MKLASFCMAVTSMEESVEKDSDSYMFLFWMCPLWISWAFPLPVVIRFYEIDPWPCGMLWSGKLCNVLRPWWYISFIPCEQINFLASVISCEQIDCFCWKRAGTTTSVGCLWNWKLSQWTSPLNPLKAVLAPFLGAFSANMSNAHWLNHNLWEFFLSFSLATPSTTNNRWIDR